MSKARKHAVSRRASNRNMEFEMSVKMNDHLARQEGPTQRKTWSAHDLKAVRPLTETQDEMFHAWMNGMNVCAHGFAGTGKTFLALYLALNELFKEGSPYKKIKIVRSAVPTRDIGFLPGTPEEKLASYEGPYRDILASLIGRYSTYDDMKAARIIEFVPTSFLRGLTWDNCIVIMDEAQSMSFHEISTAMTRLGDYSRLMVLGDVTQNDLIYKKNDVSGFAQMLEIIKRMNSFADLTFNEEDIVRSAFVKSWIIACNNTQY
jgi:phosphate starvation-inducible protein PhoH